MIWGPADAPPRLEPAPPVCAGPLPGWVVVDDVGVILVGATTTGINGQMDVARMLRPCTRAAVHSAPTRTLETYVTTNVLNFNFSGLKGGKS